MGVLNRIRRALRGLATEKRLLVLYRVMEEVMPYGERMEQWHPLLEVLWHLMTEGSF